MTKIHLTNFTVDLEYDHIRGKELMRFGSYQKLHDSVYRWRFLLKDIQEIQKILDEVLEFDKEDILRDVLPHCDPLIKELEADVGTYKKTSTYQIAVVEEGYRVSWHKGSGEEESHGVTRVLIEHIWENVLKDMEPLKPEQTPKVAEKIVRSLSFNNWDRHRKPNARGWHNFISDLFAEKKDAMNMESKLVGKEWFYETSGDFNWKHFFGSRKEYFKLFYVPMKAFVALGLVEHTKGGYVIRQEGEFKLQKEFKELDMVLYDKEAENKAKEHEGIDEWDWEERVVRRPVFTKEGIRQ